MSHASDGGERVRRVAVLAAVALLSAAIIAAEVVLMRRLLVERWHHFGFLVISIAMLGFGISGTMLAVLSRQVRRRPGAVMWVLALLTALALEAAPRVCAALPVSAKFIPQDLRRQAGWWLLYWAAAAMPFLFGAGLIGAALMLAGPRIGHVYAANLIGSAAGAAGAALVLSRWALETALWPPLAMCLAGAVVLAGGGTPRAWRRRVAITAAVAVPILALEAVAPVPAAPDEFKTAAAMRRLVAQGSARLVARGSDAHGDVEIYESSLFHDLPFLATGRSPPPMLGVVVAGDGAGSILRVSGAEEAAVMDGTLVNAAYPMAPARPRVLLIGETGGASVWLARRRSASSITVVQPNMALVGLLRGELAEVSGGVMLGDDLRVVTRDPRAFLREKGGGEFDLIHIVSLEGLGLGIAGSRGLAEDHLMTVEGLGACLARLSSEGVLVACRGVQFPERENIRILATLAESLESIGAAEPAHHIVVVRDFLGVCTMGLRRPLDDQRRARVREVLGDMNLTPVWFNGVLPEEVNRPDALPGPPGTSVDWLHHAASRIFSPARREFLDSWMLGVEPAHDDAPFFWDFYKPGAMGVLREAYGDLWLTRAETGRLFLYASLVITLIAGAVFVLAPLALMRSGPGAPRTSARLKLAMVVYFASIGVGFMGIEMALISRAALWLGDPVTASAAVIAGMLVLCGLGSAVYRARSSRLWRPAMLVLALGLIIAGIAIAGHESGAEGVRIGAAVLILSIPLCLCMGRPMPAAIALLDQRAPALVPWAWGINGVASVAGAPLAIVVAMGLGYRNVLAFSAAMYGLAALAGAAMTGVRRVTEPSGTAGEERREEVEKVG